MASTLCMHIVQYRHMCGARSECFLYCVSFGLCVSEDILLWPIYHKKIRFSNVDNDLRKPFIQYILNSEYHKHINDSTFMAAFLCCSEKKIAF